MLEVIKKDDLFAIAEKQQREQAMQESIAEVSTALATLGRGQAWSDDVKASDNFLDPVFRLFLQSFNFRSSSGRTITTSWFV